MINVQTRYECVECHTFGFFLPSAYKRQLGDPANSGTFRIRGDYLVWVCFGCESDKPKRRRKKQEIA